MKQYCRYCCFCSNGDTYYCGEYEKELSREKVRRANRCKRYMYCVLGDVDTHKQYRPQAKRKKSTQQETLF